MCSTRFHQVIFVPFILLFFSCTGSKQVLRSSDPPAFKVEQTNDTVNISWGNAGMQKTAHWLVRYRYGNKQDSSILGSGARTWQLPAHNGKSKLKSVSVAAIDHRGNENKGMEIDPNVLAILPRAAWNPQDPRPYKKHIPVQITVHHEGGRVLADTADAARRIKNIQVWGMGKDRNWTDIPYHFLVAADGTVYEGRDLYTVGETNTEYDPSGHLLICFLGNYQEQEFTPHLQDILTRLIAHFCTQYNIAPETVASHRDHSNQTTCPGKKIYPYFENGYVKNRVMELLKARQ